MVDYEKIPQELQDRRQWVCWKMEMKDGRLTKVPYQPHRPQWKASTTNPDTWSTFTQARKTAETGFDGIGFVFSPEDPYTGVDLDNCRNPDTGEIEAWALKIIEDLDSYTEISPSSTGLHVIVRGKLPPGGRSKGGQGPEGLGKIEMFDAARYFTMTGDLL